MEMAGFGPPFLFMGLLIRDPDAECVKAIPLFTDPL